MSSDRPIVRIRPVIAGDGDAMWRLFKSAIARGDALPFDENFDRTTFQAHWFTTQVAYVATQGAALLGMYKLGPNYPGRGSHVASATYLVDPAEQGKGIGRTLVLHSLEQARSEGYLAMQFNYVVGSNAPAVELYKKLGFAIVGTLPKAFRHLELGLVDAYVMFRSLQEE